MAEEIRAALPLSKHSLPTTTASESLKKNDECAGSIRTPIAAIHTLSYDGKTYVIPETMRGI